MIFQLFWQSNICDIWQRIWRTREGPIRTVSLIPIHIKVPLESTIALYQKLAPKIKEMKALGMSYREIAQSLGVNKKTVGRALELKSSLKVSLNVKTDLVAKN